jgi:predicted Ser/Thr protein kinase
VPQPGDVVAGKYEVARLLGKGGMGVVVEATHRKLGTRVAIKFLMPDALTTSDGVARFDREARAAALLRSRYVVRVLDIDTTADGLPFIVMEYLEGFDLGAELKRRKVLGVAEAVDFVLEACIGLAEAHAHGIVHRDIKPGNLYVCEDSGLPVVKVMDFGVSKLIAASNETELTATNTTVGTPSYMAPEQLLSSKEIDHRADVWALGVVLYRMLSGSLPFVGATPTALAIAIATEPPVPLASVAPSLPRGLVEQVERVLQKDPARRFEDVVAFGRALVPFGSGRVAFATEVAGFPAPAARGSDPALRARASRPEASPAPRRRPAAHVTVPMAGAPLAPPSAPHAPHAPPSAPSAASAASVEAVVVATPAGRPRGVAVGIAAVVVAVIFTALVATAAVRIARRSRSVESSATATATATTEVAAALASATEVASASPATSSVHVPEAEPGGPNGPNASASATPSSFGPHAAAPAPRPGGVRAPAPRGASAVPRGASPAPAPSAPPPDPLHL